MSTALGSHFSGNGDVLTFLRRARRTVSDHRVPNWLDPSFGPVITSAIRVGDALDGDGDGDGDGDSGRGFYVEDGGYPQFLSWMVEAAGAPHMAARLARFLLARSWAHLTGLVCA